MGRLAGLKYRDVIRRLKALGFVFDRPGTESHEIWRNPATRAKISLPRHAWDMAEGTLRTILREAHIEVDDFLGAG